MRNKLIVLGRFARVVAAFHRLALVKMILVPNIVECFGAIRLKLSIAAFADADHGRGVLYDPQFSGTHVNSLAHSEGRQ